MNISENKGTGDDAIRHKREILSYKKYNVSVLSRGKSLGVITALCKNFFGKIGQKFIAILEKYFTQNCSPPVQDVKC